jgi:hypothetical protein
MHATSATQRGTSDQRSSKREDILVSVCFPDYAPGMAQDSTLRKLASEVDAAFRYWEFIVIADASSAHEYEHLAQIIENIRLIWVRPGLPYYRRRAVAASEAIGDVVVLGSIGEMPCLNVVSMIHHAADTGSIVTGENLGASSLNPLIRTLGLASGFHVDVKDLSTSAYPRTLINRLLAHSNHLLALRFTPRDDGLTVTKFQSNSRIRHRKSMLDWTRRLGMFQKLFVNSAPTILSFVASLSVLSLLLAVIYALYVVITWVTLDTIQPGWVTTSLVLSATVGFLGIAFLGISMGLQIVLDKLSPDIVDDVVGETSAVDLFGQLSNDLNVEVDVDALGEGRS